MLKKDARKWRDALYSGKYEKLRGKMSNGGAGKKPTACCCLGVANETFKIAGHEEDRTSLTAEALVGAGILSHRNPKIFGINASSLNDGFSPAGSISEGVYELYGKPLSHIEVGMLLDLAIESGEYKNI